MAPDAKVACAGGLGDGSFGTSFEKIHAAVESVYSNDGVLILMDLGSAVMTTEMVIEAMEGRKIRMADCPLVEGAVQATICAASGMDLDSILAALQEVKTTKKF